MPSSLSLKKPCHSGHYYFIIKQLLFDVNHRIWILLELDDFFDGHQKRNKIHVFLDKFNYVQL